MQKTPYTLVIGDKECEENSVTYRRFGNPAQIPLPLNEFIEMLQNEIKNKDLLV